MKVFLVFAGVVALCAGDVGLSSFGGYSSGPGSSSFGSIGSIGNRNRNNNRNQNQRVEVLADNYVSQVYKHVYVHAAEDEEPSVASRVIRVPGGDKHVNIIFVKAPSQSSSGQTEVILPDQDEHKNLVYVLLKKDEAENNVKITRPQQKRPTKPEVHFIRYADNANNANAVDNSGVGQAPQPQRPSSEYGTPADVPPPHNQAQDIAAAPVIPSGLYGTPQADFAPPPKTPAGLYGTPSQ